MYIVFLTKFISASRTVFSVFNYFFLKKFTNDLFFNDDLINSELVRNLKCVRNEVIKDNASYCKYRFFYYITKILLLDYISDLYFDEYLFLNNRSI
jgi:hypothetical protein